MRAVLIALGLFFASTTNAQVLATVGNSKITVEDFRRKLNDIKKKTVNPPTPEQYLEDLIRYEIGVQEAEKMKLANDPLVKERFRQVLYNSLLEKQIGKKVEGIKITESEMRQFYKNNPEVRIAHILIDMKPNPTAEERETTHKRAQEILAEVKKSKRPFPELVKLYSDDLATKEMGGEIGYQSRVTLFPSHYELALNMKAGEIRGLLETQFGFHIIKLIERRSYDLADKRQIRAALHQAKQAKIFNDYFEKLKKGYSVDVNREALKSIKN